MDRGCWHLETRRESRVAYLNAKRCLAVLQHGSSTALSAEACDSGSPKVDSAERADASCLIIPVCCGNIAIAMHQGLGKYSKLWAARATSQKRGTKI